MSWSDAKLLQAPRFDHAHGSRAKADRVDARMLAQMGKAFALQPDRPADETIRELKELQIARTALVKDRTRLLNRIKTQALSLTKRHSKARVAQIERQLAAIQTEIETRLRGDDGKARKGGSCATPSICLPSSPCASTSRCRKNTRR